MKIAFDILNKKTECGSLGHFLQLILSQDHMKESMQVYSMGMFCSRVGGLMKIFTQSAGAMSLRDLTNPHKLTQQHAA